MSFTLIELLVVVAIIAALVAVLLPALQAAREQARVTVCQNNIKQLMMAQLYYAQDYGHFGGYDYTGSPPLWQVQGYISSSILLDVWWTSPGQPVNFPPYVCPNVPPGIKTTPPGVYGYSGVGLPYGWNSLLGGHVYTYPNVPAKPYCGFWRVDQIEDPARRLGWTECVGHGVVYPPAWIWPWEIVIRLRHGGGTEISAWEAYQGLRTTNFANASFVDGHVGRVHDADSWPTALYGPWKQ